MGELFNTRRRYSVTINGRIHAELKGRRSSPPVIDEIAGFLDRLDGRSRFSVNLWQLPADTPFDRIKLDQLPARYLQTMQQRQRSPGWDQNATAPVRAAARLRGSHGPRLRGQAAHGAR